MNYSQYKRSVIGRRDAARHPSRGRGHARLGGGTRCLGRRVSWTSPGDGTASIAGGIWRALKVVNDGVGGNHQVRSSDWRITLNGAALTGGTLSSTDLFTSLAPFDLALTDLAIAANDVLTLEFISPRSFATFNGVDLTVSLDTVSVPEPGL